MLVYVDYNILGRVLDARSGRIKRSRDSRWDEDHQSVKELFDRQGDWPVQFAICREDALEEFRAYSPETMRNYADIAQNLPDHMLGKWELFATLKPLKLLIAPYGDYGYGCGPYGGGKAEHYDVLRSLRGALGTPEGATSHKDRDARHLLHAVLHRCDVFLTMDYKTILDPLTPISKELGKVLSARESRLVVLRPTELLEKLKTGPPNRVAEGFFPPLSTRKDTKAG
jgi:hypothetical protein